MALFAYLFAPRSLRGLSLLVATVLLALAAAASAKATVPYRGVQLHSLWSGVSYADLDRELDLSRDAGANTVRADVAWSSLQTDGPDSFSQWYVDKLDHFVAGADARGMKVIATLHTTPCWASSAPETLKQGCSGAWWDRGVTKYMPTNPLDYARAAQWVTSRYGTKLAALEVWNEPNEEHDNFMVSADKPAAYTALVKATYPLAKAGNADVPVLAGALSFADRPFLDALYAHGIKGSYDGISVHPYNESRAPADLWQDQWKKYTLVPGLRWIHEGQTAAGDATPIWITELGWTSCTVGADPWCVTEDQQARYVRDAFPTLDGIDYVKAAMVYNLRNKGTDPADTEANFGLVRRDFSPKPAYAALKQALTGASTATTTSGATGGSTGATSGGSTTTTSGGAASSTPGGGATSTTTGGSTAATMPTPTTGGGSTLTSTTTTTAKPAPKKKARRLAVACSARAVKGRRAAACPRPRLWSAKRTRSTRRS